MREGIAYCVIYWIRVVKGWVGRATYGMMMKNWQVVKAKRILIYQKNKTERENIVDLDFVVFESPIATKQQFPRVTGFLQLRNSRNA